MGWPGYQQASGATGVQPSAPKGACLPLPRFLNPRQESRARASHQALDAQLPEAALLCQPPLPHLINVLGKCGAVHCRQAGRQAGQAGGAGRRGRQALKAGAGRGQRKQEAGGTRRAGGRTLKLQKTGAQGRWPRGPAAGIQQAQQGRRSGHSGRTACTARTLDLCDPAAVVVELEGVAALKGGGMVGGLVVVVLTQVGGAAGAEQGRQEGGGKDGAGCCA